MSMDPEVFESLRAECERLKHRQAAMESDIARVESLKEKVSALSWENDNLKEKSQALRADLNRYRGVAAALQFGHLVWKQTPEARAAREKVSPVFTGVDRFNLIEMDEQDKPVEYQGLNRLDVPK